VDWNDLVQDRDKWRTVLSTNEASGSVKFGDFFFLLTEELLASQGLCSEELVGGRGEQVTPPFRESKTLPLLIHMVVAK